MAQRSRDASPASSSGDAQARFGTFGGVFTPCVLTILGVIMFMRSGFVVGYRGVWSALIILAISKLITTLTALSISAISTNTKIKGGGVYFMISRVLGPDFGGSIGITLYLAQAVGVAFYIIGFTEALFSVLAPLLLKVHLWGMDGMALVDKFYVAQILSTALTFALFFLTSKGADIAIKAQYVVLAILLLSVAAFIVGGLLHFDAQTFAANARPVRTDEVGFWTAFAIFFPAVTGITAGANMSGDLKKPERAIPWGTLLAIVFTGAIYVTQLILMAGYTERTALIERPFETLQEMSVFAPLVVLGVFAATLSSALGSFLGAPRILQAMGQDRLMKVMVFFGKGEGPTNEPKRATILTFILAVGVIWAGDLNAVAEVISMFFLIAYGMINLSAFVESKSNNPSFRPTFKAFHWTTALAGAVGCTVAMMKINDTYALIALAITAMLYFYLRKSDIETNFGDAKRGYIFQRTKDNLLLLEGSKPHPKNWRPVLLAVVNDPMNAHQIVRTAGWLESGRGLLTVAAILERPNEPLDAKLRLRAAAQEELGRVMDAEGVAGFCQCQVSDAYLPGLIDFLQSYSIGALRPNTVLLEMPSFLDDEGMASFFKKVDVVATFNHNLTILKRGDFAPNRKRRTIDLWWRGEANGSLMAIFAYLITLHPTWSGASLRLLRVVTDGAQRRKAQRHMEALRTNIRIPATVQVIESAEPVQSVIARESGGSDLVLLGINAANGEDARRSVEGLSSLLAKLPTTIMVWSNGEADIFA